MGDELRGLNALVTGGASGIGAATAGLLAAEGARVAVLDAAPEGADPRHLVLRCDVTDDTEVRGAVDGAAGELGGLDIVVNNAAVGARGTVEDNGDDEWRAVLEANVLGTVRVSRAALPYLRRSSAAAVVNTCSVAAAAGLPARALYSATKGAVLALTRSMAADHLAEGVRVNCVSPGTVDTPWVGRLLEAAPDPDAERRALEERQPHGRLVHAREVAGAVLHLASPRSGSTTGVSLPVDGGMQGLRMPPPA